MITYDEINAVKLSATKKDFYQLWNELLETARQISDRYDPANTNESDPGVVLLKVLTAVADKLNYEIDVAALGGFMPSVAEEESMRKLCDMLGYSMKYFQSATTKVKLIYNLDSSYPIPGILTLDRFTNIKDIDDTVNFVTTSEVRFSHDINAAEVVCIEGELLECETDDDNIISLLQLDDNHRYYLPETQIAENGIFVTNLINSDREGEDWVKVDNLNTQPLGKHCYKFGYDSKENLPYLQLPDDISNIIEDGLKIRYIRTNGVNGNITAKTLCKMEKPASWSALEQENESEDAKYLNPDNYVINNPAAATNGSNPETITNAYNSFKKTIGTFDTLVTCRDYINRIYQLTVSDVDSNPLVSNVVVSDIRDDINHAITMCTFGEHGIEYKHIARPISANTTYSDKASLEAALKNATDKSSFVNKIYEVTNNSKKEYYTPFYNGSEWTLDQLSGTAINHFDLVFYTFTPTSNLNNKLEYKKSFLYDDSNFLTIQNALEENKTLAHNIVKPNQSDIACIKNYYRLNVKLSTTRRVNIVEQKDILNNVYKKLFETFNARKVDFGEALVEDSIKNTIKSADPRIKELDWNTPTITTKVCTVAGAEYDISSATITSSETASLVEKSYFNKLALNNVLAGRIPLFAYNESFTPSYDEKKYPAWGTGSSDSYNQFYPESISSTQDNGISKIETECAVTSNVSNLKLKDNEVIQFRFPNLKTIVTYPAYVNYYLHLTTTDSSATGAEPAIMSTLWAYLSGDGIDRINGDDGAVVKLGGESVAFTTFTTGSTDPTVAQQESYRKEHWLAKIVTPEENESTEPPVITYAIPDTYVKNTTYYKFVVDKTNYASWRAFLAHDVRANDSSNATLANNYFYYIKLTDPDIPIGYLVDNAGHQYLQMTEYKNFQFDDYYICKNEGKNAKKISIAAGEEYRLQPNEYLLIDYTSSSADDSSKKTVIDKVYREGTIVKPNIQLVDSEINRSMHAYNKTSGYNFTTYEGITNPNGMFTLAANEQIEIRDFVVVELDEAYTNIYWKLNNEVVKDDNRIYFIFDEEPKTINGEVVNTAYTLKDGEYIYYTDKDKTDLAYYGAGTKVTRDEGTPPIFKYKSEEEPSIEDILTLGLGATIPWRLYDFSNKHGLTLTEYQYITLTKDDTLVSLSGVEHFANETGLTVVNIGNAWRNVNNAEYKFAGSEKEPLPAVQFGTDLKWQVKSILELNVGPNTTQTLTYNAGTTGSALDKVKITINNQTDPVVLEPRAFTGETSTTYRDLSLKSNLIIQSASDTTQVGIYDEATNTTLYTCQLKLFEEEELHDSGGKRISLNNFNKNSFTEITFDNQEIDWTKNYEYPLNILLPNDSFGLVMVHCYNPKNSYPRITLTDESGTEVPPIIYNNGGTWWIDTTVPVAAIAAVAGTPLAAGASPVAGTNYYTRTASVAGAGYLNDGEYAYTLATPTGDFSANTYYPLTTEGSNASTNYVLHKGINIIQIPTSCTLKFIATQAEKEAVIIFGGLDIISSDDEKQINPQLHYSKITAANPMAQILSDISAVDPDHKFYYNTIVESETALDLHYKQSLKEYLDDTYVWFNYNNINNKFVISELDYDKLSDIDIAKNSKL